MSLKYGILASHLAEEHYVAISSRFASLTTRRTITTSPRSGIMPTVLTARDLLIKLRSRKARSVLSNISHLPPGFKRDLKGVLAQFSRDAGLPDYQQLVRDLFNGKLKAPEEILPETVLEQKISEWAEELLRRVEVSINREFRKEQMRLRRSRRKECRTATQVSSFHRARKREHRRVYRSNRSLVRY